MKEGTTSDEREHPPEQAKIPKERLKLVMRQTVDVLKKLGKGTSGLIFRIRKSESLQDMQETITEYRSANESEREKVGQRLEKLHAGIAGKKQEFAAAAPARKRIIEMELKTLLSQHKAVERTYGVLLENERTLNLVLDRLAELNAYSLGGIDEGLIDKLTDEIEDKSLEAELKSDSVADLEKAGHRRESSMDSDDLWTELEAFENQPEESGFRDTQDGVHDISEESDESVPRKETPLEE